MPSHDEPHAKIDVQLPAHPQQNRRNLLDRRLSDPPYRPSPDSNPPSVETEKRVLERIKADLGRLAREAEAIDATLLAHLIDTSLHEAENVLRLSSNS